MNAHAHNPGAANAAWRAATFASIVAALLCVCCTQALAQDDQSPRSRRKALKDMNDEELKEAGFEWEAQNTYGGSLDAAAVAALPGFFFHGLGHLYVGDFENGWNMVIAEAIGLGLMGLGALIYFQSLDDEQRAILPQVGIGLGQLGGALFVASYATDVIGTIKGNQSELPALSIPTEGVRARADYRFVSGDGIAPLHLLDVHLTLDFGTLFIRPRASIEARFLYQLYGADIGLRLLQGKEPHTFFAVRVRGERAAYEPETGAQVIDSQGKVLNSVLRIILWAELDLDLGVFSEHLRHIVNEIDVGLGFTNQAGTRPAFPGEEQQLFLSFEESLGVNILSSLFFRLLYRYDRTEFVAPYGVGLGALGGELHLITDANIRVHLYSMFGTGYSLGVGLIYEVF